MGRIAAPVNFLIVATVGLAWYVYKIRNDDTLPDPNHYVRPFLGSEVAKFCAEYSDWEWENCGGGLRRQYPGALESYVEACEATFNGLSEEQRAVLQPLVGKPMSDVVKWAPLIKKLPWTSHMLQVRSLNTEKNRSQLPRAGKSANALYNEMREFHTGEDPYWMMTLPLHDEFGGPTKIPVIEPSEVRNALQTGQTAIFDAKKILPVEIFNVSLSEISDRQGPQSKQEQFGVYTDPGVDCRRKWYASWRRLPPHFEEAKHCPPLMTLNEAIHRGRVEGARFALRRVDRYMDADVHVVRSLGLDDIVERAVSQLIVGFANGDVHWDEQDNIIIAISGLCVIFAAPGNWSGSVHDRKCSGQTWDTWMKLDRYRQEEMPYYYHILQPGEGVVLPSGSIHAVYGDWNRLAMNAFLEPKFEKMKWTTSKSSYWHLETRERQALRNLWIQSIARVWDRKKAPLYAQGGFMEVL